jgi:hypothetical protein
MLTIPCDAALLLEEMKDAHSPLENAVLLLDDYIMVSISPPLITRIRMCMHIYYKMGEGVIPFVCMSVYVVHSRLC